ncbi:hypothetical protein MRX96_031910 [Rhipicephalus microplus]
MLEIMTKRLQIETHYAQAKAVLGPEYLLVLKEILDYNTPSVNINNALQAAKRKIAVSSTMVAVWSSINNLNTLINAFDVYDSPNCPNFEKAANKTAAIRNIVFQASSSASLVTSREHRENMYPIHNFPCNG